jgi:hypothetical protein
VRFRRDIGRALVGLRRGLFVEFPERSANGHPDELGTAPRPPGGHLLEPGRNVVVELNQHRLHMINYMKIHM